MRWIESDRCDPDARPIADRHYNRQHVGAPNFVPPGRCKVFRHDQALWVSSWPFPEYVRHAWAGAWINSTFRNEGAGLSSELIREALAATRFYWPEIPSLGMVTFIDTTQVRRKRDFGRCYRRAGFHLARCPRHQEPMKDCAACESRTEGGLLALQIDPVDIPQAEAPLGTELRLFETVC